MKIVKRTFVACVLICLLGLAASALRNFYANRAARQRAVMPGKLYMVDGYAMHLYCTGSGSPTIMLSTGLGDDFTIWAKVQPELAKVTQVCSYDRAGTGWSQSRPGLQDADGIAAQLHELLKKAGVDRPFVLVGHSISGLYVRSYAAHYGADLAGIVLLDPSTPHQDDLMPKEIGSRTGQRREMMRQQRFMALGWTRLRGQCGEVPQGFEADRPFFEAWNCDPAQMTAAIEELDGWDASERETDGVRTFGAVPLLILSSDPTLGPDDDDRKAMSAAVFAQSRSAWDAMQEETKALSSNSRRVIAKGSTHYVQVDRAELVIREVSSLVEQIRQHQPMSGVGGTTVE